MIVNTLIEFLSAISLIFIGITPQVGYSCPEHQVACIKVFKINT